MEKDTRELKKAHEELVREERKLRRLLYKAPIGMFVIDLFGRFEYANARLLEITGQAAEKWEGKNFAPLVHPDDLPLVTERINRAIKGDIDTTPYEIRVFNQSKRTINLKIYPEVLYERNDKGEKEIIGFQVFAEDVTEQRKMEEEILKSKKLESVGILAGGIAHDFNNILAGMLVNISYAKTLADPDDKIYRLLTEAENASRRARELTQQLLTFSRGGTPIKERTSINELIEETVNFSLRGSNVRAEFSLIQDLWAVEVDKGQISQVVNNLVINAKQAMPGGGAIEVGARNIPRGRDAFASLENGKYIEFYMKDKGVGIPAEYISRIFDPFFTTKQEGSGLGLAISYSIVKKHGGVINAESQPGKGSKFRVFLPASGDAPVVARLKKGARKRISGKILLMDDEEIIRKSVSRILRDMGCQTREAGDGGEAIKLYKKALDDGNKFDVVILDLTVPGGMGGKKTIEILLKIDPDVKAIVASGYSTDPIIDNYRSHGFKEKILKPYDYETLSDALRKTLAGGKKQK